MLEEEVERMQREAELRGVGDAVAKADRRARDPQRRLRLEPDRRERAVDRELPFAQRCKRSCSRTGSSRQHQQEPMRAHSPRSYAPAAAGATGVAISGLLPAFTRAPRTRSFSRATNANMVSPRPK